jgi:uracil-DNA glycosylase
VQTLLNAMEEDAPKLILFGAHAKDLKKQFTLDKFETIELEHPYNHTFISNPQAIKLFGPMNLLDK